MKKVFLVLTLLFSMSFQSNSQWVLQNPFPPPYNLNQAFFISPEVGWIAGDKGTLLKTTDKGFSWITQEISTQLNLTAVYFITENIGFIAGTDTLLKTTDGGSNWMKINSYMSQRIPKGFIFITDSLGYVYGGDVYGGDGFILRTTDQGNTWSYDIFNYPCLTISLLQTDINNIWALSPTGQNGIGSLFRSTDQGFQWQVISSNLNCSRSITAINNQTIWIAGGNYGNNYRIFKSTDGGNNFSVQLIETGRFLNSIVFLDDMYGVAAGDNGTIYSTTDGGENWSLRNLGINKNFNCVIFLDSISCLAVGNAGMIYRSSDKGLTWSRINERSSGNLKISFLNKDYGWAVGGKDILITNDGGISWEMRKADSTRIGNLNSVFLIDQQTAIVLDSWNNDINKTTDGGISWTNISFFEKDILSFHFFDESIGWAVGGYYGFNNDYGYIYKTTTGGTSWSTMYSLNLHLHDVFFIDSNHGWASGMGIILRTTDGGSTWIPYYGSYYTIYNSIYFLDTLNGFAVKTNSTEILKTTDGGETWTEKSFPTGGLWQNLNSIHFSSLNNGWAVGKDGFIIYTTDEGESWSRISNVTDLSLNEVFFINDSTGWISGANGLVLLLSKKGSPPASTYSSQNNSVPAKFLLFQNYPNPFNPLTTIKYNIPENSYIRISIFDLLGRQTKVLVSEEKKNGTYQMDVNMTGLPSGIYFYRIDAVGSSGLIYQEVRKMTLLK